MKYKNKIKNKQERGAITLFVLLACLFFVFILTGTYLSNLNRLQVQEQEVKQIQENYAKDIERVDEIYQNMSKANVVTELTQTIKNPTEDGWTKDGVTLTAKAEIKKENEQNTKELDEYVISKEENPNNIPNSDWTKTTSTEKEKLEVSTPEDDPITENGTYYFHIKDSDGEIHTDKIQVGKIDTTKPTPGTLVDDNGQEFSKTNPTIVDKDTYIEKVDGSDDESGHKETKYTVVKDSKIYQKIAENGELITCQDLSDPKSLTLTETGSYEITVTTKDKAGNEANNVYVIKIVVVGVELTQTMKNPTEDGWTKDGVILTANAEIDQGKDNTRQFEKYIITKEENASNVPNSEWTTVTEAQKEKIEVSTPDTEPIKENGKYYFHAVDNDGKTYTAEVEVGNIDTINPTPGTLVDDQGQEFDKTNPTVTDQDIYIEKVDGSDNESGHKQTTYTILKDSTVYTETNASGEVTTYQNVNEPKSLTLTEVGRYEITVTTKDKAGNEASNNYVIVISKEAPELILKHNDSSGINYEQGTWTKDDLYGEVNTDTTATGNVVEKYQYSEDGLTWKDISGEIIPTSIDYTTTFPISVDKPEWISGPTNNGTYYFEVQGDGTLKPNNSGVHSTTANSYFEIDLTNYPEASLEITLNTTISSENNYDFGYAEITESTTAISFNKNNTYFIKVSGTTTTSDYTTTITGGKKYYLHIGYSKDSSASSNQDTFIINSIRLKSDTLGKSINFSNYNKTNNKVTFILNENMEKELKIRAVYSDGTINNNLEMATIKIDKTAPVIKSSVVTIVSADDAKADIAVEETGSGIKGYYINTSTTSPTETSSWTSVTTNTFAINNLVTSTTYYLWTIDNVGNISERHTVTVGTANYIVDEKVATETLAEAITAASDGSTIKLIRNYTDTSTATFSKNITFNIQSYTLTRTPTITVNSGKTVEITGTGKITSGTTTINTITNKGTLTVSNSITLENQSTSYAPIYNNSSSSVININDNVQIIGYYRGIYNYYGTLNVNGGKIEATYSNSSVYGIYNYYGKTYMTTGEVKGYYGIYNYYSSAIVEITGGKVIGTGASGIYTTGTTNIYGGRVEGKTYGVYSNATDKVTIGREEDELSTSQPAIYGASYGIYMNTDTYTFNFYNGVIISNTEETAFRGDLNPRTGYMLYTYFEESDTKYHTILVQTVDNITMEATPTEFTNGDVTVKITYPYDNNIRQYSEDGTNWITTNKYIQYVTVTENKIIYARLTNESVVILDENQITINNIDKERPTVSVTPTQTNYSVSSSNGTVDISLTLSAADTGVSGIDKLQYAWAKEGETPTYVDFTDGTTITKSNLAIGQYNLYFNVTDKAGNKSELTQIRYNVKYGEPVCQIGSTTYTTVQAAVNACSKSAGSTQTTIIMLKSTDEEFSTYAGQNIILDLKGYTIGSSNLATPLCTNNAKLTLKDSSAGKTGKLESINGICIVNSGTFILGANDGTIEIEVPTIYGYKKGIENKGTFNFYDGKIQGITPIDGDVNDTPYEYGPVSTGIVDNITTMQLGIITGYEARIGWVYYEELQNAINITKSGETVTILKNLQKQNIVTINSTKNMKLDLDGYELTVSGVNTVIENYGDLEILDSSSGKTGKVAISSNENDVYAIRNKSIGNITISSGNISSNKGAIYNQESGSIIVYGGTVSGNKYGIYNAANGNVKITDGIVSSEDNSTYYDNYAIYNRGFGNIEILGGIINSNSVSSSSNSYTYGIYNANSGNIKIIGGIINSTYKGSYYSDVYGITNYSGGRVQIEGGTINVNAAGIGTTVVGVYNNSEDGYVEFSGGTINAINNDAENAQIYGIHIDNGELLMTGGDINCQENNVNIVANGQDYTNYSVGIFCDEYGTVRIQGGNIIATSKNTSPMNDPYSDRCAYGIKNSNEGTVIIGNEEQTNITQTPVIIGKSTTTNSNGYHVFGYGLYNPAGNIEIYDGKFQGTLLALSGNISKVRDGYTITETTLDSMNTIYLSKDTSTKQYVAQIDSTQFYTLQEAIDSIGQDEEKSIKIIRSFTLGKAVEFNKNIILDLNGYTITNKYYRISNSGNLKVIGSTGKITYSETISGIVNKENGYLEIQSGTITSTATKSEVKILYNIGESTIKMTGGTLNATSLMFRRYGGGIYNANSNAKLEMTGGTINSAENGIYNEEYATIKITGGTINCASTDHHSRGIYGSGRIEMTGGTITCTSKYNSNYGIYGGGNLKITGGTISCSTAAKSNYGINSWGDMEISNASITCSNSSGDAYGIYLDSKATITDGTTITVSGSTNSYGIYNESSFSRLLLGIKGDEKVSTTSPSIKATRGSSSYKGYGVYNTTGTFNFYDGKIQGSTKAVYDTITERENGTELNYQSSETILTLSTTSIAVAQIGSTTYNTLQSAINAVGTSQTTIQLLRNVTYTNNDSIITIPSGKNIILDLNGYTINSSIPETLIQNNGILKLTNTGSSGSLISVTENTIKNGSGVTLTISGTTIENRKGNTIYNEGTLNIESGTIKSNCTDQSISTTMIGIYNSSSGIVTMSGGTINNINYGNKGKSTYGIYNASTGSVTITGGTISRGTNYYSTTYGIYNASTGSIIATGVTIGTYHYGIYNASTGSVTLGSKGDGTPASGSPAITASKMNDIGGYAVYNINGTFNYYDGTLKGTGRAIYGNITEVEDLTELSVTTSGTTETIKLASKTTNAASVDGTEYDSIQKAINACGTTASTIKILRNVDPGATIIVKYGQNITLDLNNYTVKNYIELQNKGTLTITDSSTGAAGKITGTKGIAIINESNMQIQGGSVASSGYGIRNKGTLTVSGGSITSNTYGIYNEGSGTTNATGGTITGNTYGIYNYSGITNVSAAGITSNTYGIYVTGGTVNIKDGAEVQSATGIYVASGTLNIGESGAVSTTSPIITGDTYGISNSETGIVNMYDGQIKGKSGATYGYITNTQSGYTVNTTIEDEYFVDKLALAGTISTVAQVNGIDYSNLQSAINSVVGEEAQTVKLTNGIITTVTFNVAKGQNVILDMNGKTISSDLAITIQNAGNLTIIDSSGKNVAKISSSVGVAIKNTGTLTLGQDDGTVNQDILTIEGETYGLETTGTVNFYDGTINGGSALNGSITNRPDGYVIRKTSVNSKERYYLSAS